MREFDGFFSAMWMVWFYHAKISNLTITELCYSHILNINRSSLHTRSRSGACTSPFLDTDELKWLYGPEKFPGPSRNGPQPPIFKK